MTKPDPKSNQGKAPPVFKYLRGAYAVLSAKPNWTTGFDLSLKGFKISILTIFLSVPLYLLCIYSSVTNGATYGSIPLVLVAAILASMSLMSMLTIYIISTLFECMDIYRQWIIVRNWAQFFIIIIMAIIFGLFLIKLIPFTWAYSISLLLFLCPLLMDIRLAQVIANFNWNRAILTGCAISIANLVLVISTLQALFP